MTQIKLIQALYNKTLNSNLTSSNVKKGVNIGNIIGTYTPSFRTAGDTQYELFVDNGDTGYKDYSIGFTGQPIAMIVDEFGVFSYSGTVDGKSVFYDSPQSSISLKGYDGVLYTEVIAMRDKIRIIGYRSSMIGDKPFKAYGVKILYVLD